MALHIRDPIHGAIRIEPWALPLVDAPVYQRLRRIRQLGTAHLVYPGAHHKRFEHGLGAYHLAGRFATALDLDEDEALTMRAAALLHDVGHGPFSHAFEEVARAHGRVHERMSVDLVRWGPLSDPLRQAGLHPGEVADAIVGKGPLASLVAGSLDADRIDYLLRDAHYTGVRTSVDPDRLVGVVARHPDHGVVLRESGIISAESLLTMRFLMYPAVYLHHTVRASETMLKAAVRAALDEGATDLETLERETDDGLLHRLRNAGGVAAELVHRLDNRRLYKRAYEGGPDRFFDERIQALARDVAKRRGLEEEIASLADVPRHKVLLDLPRPPRFRELNLHVQAKDGSLRPLSEVSRLVQVLQEARLDHWRFWVFTPREHRDAVAKAAKALLD